MQPRLSILFRVLTLTIALGFLPFLSRAQEDLVKGRVIDASTQKAIEGANIMVQNTTGGVSTAADGSFEIQSKKGSVLVVSFIGYEQKLARRRLSYW